MTAFQTIMLSGQGAPLIPPGGSDESRLKSRIRRRLDAVDWIRESEQLKTDERAGGGKRKEQRVKVQLTIVDQCGGFKRGGKDGGSTKQKERWRQESAGGRNQADARWRALEGLLGGPLRVAV